MPDPRANLSATGTLQIEGKVLAAEPGRKLVCTQRYLFDPAAATEEPFSIAFAIEQRDGTCRLIVTQDGFPERYLFDPAAATEEPFSIAFAIEQRDGTCRLIVTQDGFPDGSAAYRDTVAGWPWIASGLKTLLETGQSLPGAGPA